MSKNINIIATDGMSVGDTNSKNPKKMIHEQAFEKFGIDPRKSYDGTGLKPLDKEWYQDIILKDINSIDNKYSPDSININRKSRTVRLGFKNKEIAENFMNQFHSNLFRSINQFIEEIGKNPKHYERGIVLSHELQGSEKGATVVISY